MSSLEQRCVGGMNTNSVPVSSWLLVKLRVVRTGWGWEYFDQSAMWSQKNPEQVVRRSRLKSLIPATSWVCGSWQISLQVFSLVK